MEMGEPNSRKQEQQTIQMERSLVELEERERDIRELEVRYKYTSQGKIPSDSQQTEYLSHNGP